MRTFGCYGTDPLFRGRREVKRLTGNYNVPTMVLDDGMVIDGSPEHRRLGAGESLRACRVALGRPAR